MSDFGNTIQQERSLWLSDEPVSPGRRDTLAIVALQHERGISQLDVGTFNFVDSVYRQVLFLAFSCAHHGIGDKNTWGSISEASFLEYFRQKMPEAGKTFLREKFAEEPRLKDRLTLRQFTAMAFYFHEILGLGPPPDWAEIIASQSALPDIRLLVSRLIRRTVALPSERSSHFRSLEAASFAADGGAVAFMEEGDYRSAGKLLIEGMIRANRQQLIL